MPDIGMIPGRIPPAVVVGFHCGQHPPGSKDTGAAARIPENWTSDGASLPSHWWCYQGAEEHLRGLIVGTMENRAPVRIGSSGSDYQRVKLTMRGGLLTPDNPNHRLIWVAWTPNTTAKDLDMRRGVMVGWLIPKKGVFGNLPPEVASPQPHIWIRKR